MKKKVLNNHFSEIAKSWKKQKKLKKAIADAEHPYYMTILEPDFDPVVYTNEPYSPDTTVSEFIQNYITGLNYLREDFLKTHDMRLYKLLRQLTPAQIFFQRYPKYLN